MTHRGPFQPLLFCDSVISSWVFNGLQLWSGCSDVCVKCSSSPSAFDGHGIFWGWLCMSVDACEAALLGGWLRSHWKGGNQR